MSSNSIELLGMNWHSKLAMLVSTAKNRLIICSPYVGTAGTELVRRNLSPSLCHSGELLFMTNLSTKNMIASSTDPMAIYSLATTIQQSEVIHLPGVHAKVFLADDEFAIVTSGNLTAGGLYRNLECGVLLADSLLVSSLRLKMEEYRKLGASVPSTRLASYGEALNGVLSALKLSQKEAETTIHSQFENALQVIDDDLIRLKLAGGTVSSVFAETILYLLRSKGPLATIEIHPEVASIHPDFCDNTVDRVIDGRRFGKKWKHAVRSAQQRLKSQGFIEFKNGLWYLK